jgi:hypothetical protein
MALDHEDNQEGISKDDFLEDLITEIDGLLEQDGGLNKFQSQFDNFCSMVESYGTELDKYRQAANNRFNDFADRNPEAQKLFEGINKLLLYEKLERLSKVRLLYIGQCSTPPTDNPTWVSHEFRSDYVAENAWATGAPLFYRPSLLELPPNPAFWFFDEMDRYLSDRDQIKQPDKRELLMCDFVRLSVIHDESCSYNKSIMVYKNRNYEGKFQRNDFVKDLWAAYKNPKKDNFIKTHKRILKQAMQHVKADLEQCETGKKKERDTRGSRDTYIANQMSFGDKAQHASRDINTIKPKGEKKWQKRLIISASIATILIFLFGDEVCTRFKAKLKSKNPTVEQVVSNQLMFSINITDIEVSARDPIWGYESFDEDEIVVKVSGNAVIPDSNQTNAIVAFWRLANDFETNWHIGRRRDGGNYKVATLDASIARSGSWDFLVGGIECEKIYRGDVMIVLLLYPQSIVLKQSDTWCRDKNGWGFSELPIGYLAVSPTKVFKTIPNRE